MEVGEICTRDVVFVQPDETVVKAAQLMREYHVGDVVVVEERADGSRIPVSILTDRDIVIGPVAQDADDIPRLLVGDVTSNKLVTADEDEQLVDVLETMRAHGVRRIPIVDDSGVLLGILAFDDVIELLAEELGALADLFDRARSREEEQRPSSGIVD